MLDNPSPLLNPFQFEITFECTENLKEDLEWKMLYDTDSSKDKYDYQLIGTVNSGAVKEGRHTFVFQANPPDLLKILKHTEIMLTCSCRNQEFIVITFFLVNEYSDP